MTQQDKDTLNDIADISEALANWFRGQEIPPGRAVSAMCNLIAAMCSTESDIVDATDKAATASQAIQGLTLVMAMKRRG